jgi:hypothetical protein
MVGLVDNGTIHLGDYNRLDIWTFGEGDQDIIHRLGDKTSFSMYTGKTEAGWNDKIGVGLIDIVMITDKKTKVKQSHYRPGKAQRVPGGRGSQVYRQSAHEGCQPYAPAAFTPQEIFLVRIPVRG